MNLKKYINSDTSPIIVMGFIGAATFVVLIITVLLLIAKTKMDVITINKLEEMVKRQVMATTTPYKLEDGRTLTIHQDYTGEMYYTISK